jgi:uncharacterized OsmC-like protein
MKNPTIASPARNNTNLVNGLDVDRLRASITDIAADPKKGATQWRVSTRWMGGTRSDTHVTSYRIGGQEVRKDFTLQADEPLEIGGTNLHANPQEYLLAALNACMTVGYVAACALEGIVIEGLRIESEGDIDLRGFLGIDASVKPGYDEIRYTVHLKAKATPAQLERVHDVVCRTSPNRFTIAHPIRLETRLVLG